MTKTEMNKLLNVNEKFNSDLKAYQQSLLPKEVVFNLGQPVGELSKFLDCSQDIMMQQNILTKAQKGHDTAVTLKQLENLPLKLNQPPFIFQSKKSGSIVVVVNEKDNENNPVVIPINKESVIFNGRNKLNVNLITSIYGRPQKHLDLWAENGLTLYSKDKTFIHSNLSGTIPDVGTNKGFKDTQI
jgi:hypothetical protein